MVGVGKEIFEELYFVDTFAGEDKPPGQIEDEEEGEESQEGMPANSARPFTEENDEAEEQMPDIPEPERPAGPGPLDETWWLLEEEDSDFSDIYEKAGDSLDKFFDYYHLYPIRFDGERKLFLARYDFPQFNKEIQHPDGKLKGVSECLGFIDFLGGFPLQNPELLTTVGEWSSRKEDVDNQKGEGFPAPPPPDDFFEGFDLKRMLLNYFYLDEEHAVTLADDLEGEPKPEGLHWWIRINLEPDDKYPVPGEFLALATRQWCALPWGEQESSPYVFSGNWMDTVYYTGGRIKDIDDSGDFPKYLVEWRKHLITLYPTDFAEYKIDDWVTILKKLPSDKQSQLWKDEDAETPDEENWVIAPLMFYGITARGTD
ncbi:MAG: hypothetical protein ACOZF2_11235 [Thermodesulfobacteriota bacterium]